MAAEWRNTFGISGGWSETPAARSRDWGGAMSAEAVAAVAAAGGMAVVQAAGTDAWTTVRRAVARLLGRGSPEQEAAELTRLDQMQTALAGAGDLVGQRERWEGVWQTRLELLLESVDAEERLAAVRQLTEIAALARARGLGVQTGNGGVAAGGDVRVSADGGSVAGAVVRVEGGVHVAGPLPLTRSRRD